MLALLETSVTFAKKIALRSQSRLGYVLLTGYADVLPLRGELKNSKVDFIDLILSVGPTWRQLRGQLTSASYLTNCETVTAATWCNEHCF